MGWKSSFVKRANRALHCIGLQIVTESDAQKLAKLKNRKKSPKKPGFSLDEALARVRAHRFDVQSVIDVGASNGIWSERAVRHFPDAQFLLVEALREREPELARLTERYPKFSYVLAAAGESAGNTTLNVADDLDGSAVGTGLGANARTVPMTTLDLEVARRQLRPPFFIKLDTHGFEVPILRGSPACLAQTAVLMIEVYNFHFTPWALLFPEMCAHLDGLGFRCFDMVNPILRVKDDCLWQMDLLFAPKSAAIFEYEQYR